MRDLFVVVSGAPGSGKSTLARPLAAALDLPLFEKDVIKEALGDSLGAASLDESRRLGAAANAVLFALVGANRAGVVESAWLPELVAAQFAHLPVPIVEVYCDCPVDLSISRYTERGSSRHAVHFDAERSHDRSAWAKYALPVDGGWPVVRVDTAGPYDIDAIARDVEAAL